MSVKGFHEMAFKKMKIFIWAVSLLKKEESLNVKLSFLCSV